MKKHIEEQNGIYMIVTRFWSYMYEILHRPMKQLRLVGQGLLVIKASRPILERVTPEIPQCCTG